MAPSNVSGSSLSQVDHHKVVTIVIIWVIRVILGLSHWSSQDFHQWSLGSSQDFHHFVIRSHQSYLSSQWSSKKAGLNHGMCKTGLIVATVLKNHCMQDPQPVFKAIGSQEAFDLNPITQESRTVFYIQVGLSLRHIYLFDYCLLHRNTIYYMQEYLFSY